MKNATAIALLAVLSCAGAAQATMTFSDVLIGGSLSAGASANPGIDSIDFLFPAALVGDPVAPLRSGNLIVAFNVDDDTTPIAKDLLSLVAAPLLSGSGTVFVNETVEDMTDPNNPHVVATFNGVLDKNTQFPFNATLDFANATQHVRIKKTLVLTAADTPDFDLADMTQMSQSFVHIPEPITVVGVVLGGLTLWRRRN